MSDQIPVTLGESYEIFIDSLGTVGEGVGRVNGFTIFVDDAIIKERVLVKIVEVKKNFARGKIEKVLVKNVARRDPVCPIYNECGGCQFQHLSYEAQLQYKYIQVVSAITRIGQIKDAKILPVIGAKNPLHYRNKMQFPIRIENGNAIIGCFAKGTHNVINTDHCFIEDEQNNDLLVAAKQVINELRIPVYDENTKRGVLRHIMGRVGGDNTLMVVIITATKELPREMDIVRKLRERLPNLVSVYQNVQPQHNNVILGDESKKIFGKPTIYGVVGEFKFHISPKSFFQVNTPQTKILYDTALEFAGLTGAETVVDAYCGTGTISLFLAKKAKKVYGIEIVSSAIQDAKKNAQENNIRNADFLVGDAVNVLPRLFKMGVKPDVIVLDPPRAGSNEVVLETFAAMNPKRIIYVSCNPQSLARDLAILQNLNYKTIKVQPVDMFPQTNSVESVALIQKV